MNDFDLQQQLAEQRRRQYAGQRDYQNPQGQMVGRHYVAPNALQYLAAGLRSIGGMRGQDLAEQELKQLGEQKTQGNQKALAEFLRQSQGTPEQKAGYEAPSFDEQDAQFMGQQGMSKVTPAIAPNPTGAYSALLQAPGAEYQQMGMRGLAEMPQIAARQQEREADRTFKQQEREAAAQQRMEQLKAQHDMRMQAMADQNASRQMMAEEQRNFQREMASVRQSTASAQPYYQPLQTAQGVMAFNARTGRVEPVMGPSGAVIGSAADPALQGAIAGAKSGATTEAKMRTEAKVLAPQAIAQADEAVKLVDDLLKAPGFKQAVGASRMLGMQKIPGTDAKDFDIRLDQLKGKQFLQAFESLKGGGQITEVEGKKATDAIARMDAAGSEQEFTKAAREFQAVIREGARRAKAAAGSGQAQPAARLKFDAQGNIIP
jgi:hypothetical protein